jgi:hypothetical protein
MWFNAESCYAECHYAQCYYAECHYAERSALDHKNAIFGITTLGTTTIRIIKNETLCKTKMQHYERR